MTFSTVGSNTYNSRVHHLHVVQDGETPESLAASHHTDTGRILSENPQSKFEPGELIKIEIKASSLS